VFHVFYTFHKLQGSIDTLQMRSMILMSFYNIFIIVYVYQYLFE